MSTLRTANAIGLWIFFAAMATSGLTGCDTDPATDNCGRFEEGWTAPEGCDCRLIDGAEEWVDPEGEVVPVTCEDERLNACPSSTGAGCYMLGLSQFATDEGPALVELHLDIAGHMHDLCCAQNYYSRDGASYDVSCNGCTALGSGSLEACPNRDGDDTPLFGKALNHEFPCGLEWQHAAVSYLDVHAWHAPFDTSTRWTGPQLVERNMGGTDGPYLGVEAPDGTRPLFGRALARSPIRSVDLRAPAGMAVGTDLLSQPAGRGVRGLGLSAEQIGSFCQSESATLDDSLTWVCD